MNKNKKNLFTILFIIVIVIIIIIFFNRNENKIKKGYKLFGNEYCKGHSDGIGLTVMTSYACNICGTKKEAGSSPAPLICIKCSKITGRCNRCGKLLENN